MKKLILFFTISIAFAINITSAQIETTLLQDIANSNGQRDWSIGGTGEHLDIREPEQNKLWARFVDDQRLELRGTPNLLAFGNVEAKGDLIAGINRRIFVGNTTNSLALTAASCCPGAFIDFHGGPLIFREAGNASDAPLIIQKNGSVVINAKAIYGGQTIPTNGHELSVNGGIFCEEIEVVSDVPNSDYVFESDYPLLPLAKVEEFITENKHLPEVPSAEEFKKGYKLGQMDDLLLRKVEELTLYLIDINKKVEQLEKENQALRAIVKESNN